jgi:hypothetical protein
MRSMVEGCMIAEKRAQYPLSPRFILIYMIQHSAKKRNKKYPDLLDSKKILQFKELV